MHLRVTLYDEPILRQKGDIVTDFNPSLKKLAEDMIETMNNIDATGLAAQQVGKAIQLCVMDVSYVREKIWAKLDGKEIPVNLMMPLVLVNPELIPTSSETVVYAEGCMSFPGGIYLDITRPKIVHVKYQDLQGVPHELQCDGILARCIQHEYDHLHGILFIDRADRRDVMQFESKLKKLRRQTRDFIKHQPKSHS